MKNILQILCLIAIIIVVGIINSTSPQAFQLVGSGVISSSSSSSSSSTSSSSGGSVGSIIHNGTPFSLDNAYVGVYDLTYPTATAGAARYGHIYVHDSNGVTGICTSLNDAAGNMLRNCSGTRADNSPGWINCDSGSAYTLTATTYMTTVSSPNGTITIGHSSANSDTEYTTSDCNANKTTGGQFAYQGPLAVRWDNNPGDPE